MTNQEAIDMIKNDILLHHSLLSRAYRKALNMGIEALQEQKTGKWITKNDTNPYYTSWWYECSECGQKPLRDGYGQEELSDYCPHCGCRMEREEE